MNFLKNFSVESLTTAFGTALGIAIVSFVSYIVIGVSNYYATENDRVKNIQALESSKEAIAKEYSDFKLSTQESITLYETQQKERESLMANEISELRKEIKNLRIELEAKKKSTPSVSKPVTPNKPQAFVDDYYKKQLEMQKKFNDLSERQRQQQQQQQQQYRY